MAEKRMFTQKIIDSDAFLDMPLSAQALYFHLNMRADDDGFVNNPKKITRYVSASDDDLKLLLAKRFIIGFDSGVIVIKHWRMHNTLKSDRYHPTDYQEEFAALEIKDNKAYTERRALPIPEVEPNRNQNGSKLEPQIRIDIDKKRIDKNVCVCASDDDEDDGFDEFWAAYPSKSGDIRQAYFEYLGVLKSGVDPKILLDAVKWQREAKEPRYMGSAEKWLRNKGWTEQKPDPKPVGEKKSKRGYTSAADYVPPPPPTIEELDALLEKI